MSRRIHLFAGKFLPLFIILSLMGCSDDKKVITSTTAKSPDGNWAATVDVVQYGGPGTAGLQTEVNLSPTRQPDERVMVLLIEPDQTNSLNSQQVSVSWQGSKHLNIQYPATASIDFQAIKAFGIPIVSSAVSGTSAIDVKARLKD